MSLSFLTFLNVAISVFLGLVAVAVAWTLRDALRQAIIAFDQLQQIMILNAARATDRQYFCLREGQIARITIHQDGSETWEHLEQ